MAAVWDSTRRARSIVSVGDVQGPQCILTTQRLSEATELPASIWCDILTSKSVALFTAVVACFSREIFLPKSKHPSQWLSSCCFMKLYFPNCVSFYLIGAMLNDGVLACVLGQQRHMGVNCIQFVSAFFLKTCFDLLPHSLTLNTNRFHSNCNCSDDGNWCRPCWGQIAHSRGLGITIFYKIPTFLCSTWLIINSRAAPLTVCSRNTANKSITAGWGQRKEIGFCQACRQVLNLEYLSHIKSTFIGCYPRPPPLSPPEAVSGCVECVSMKEVLRDKLVAFCSSPPWVLKEDAVVHQQMRAARVEFIEQ